LASCCSAGMRVQFGRGPWMTSQVHSGGPCITAVRSSDSRTCQRYIRHRPSATVALLRLPDGPPDGPTGGPERYAACLEGVGGTKPSSFFFFLRLPSSALHTDTQAACVVTWHNCQPNKINCQKRCGCRLHSGAAVAATPSPSNLKRQN